MAVESVEVRCPLSGLNHRTLALNVALHEQVVGQKAIVECSGTATQKNGRPYNNL
jgi:hypothetical protein